MRDNVGNASLNKIATGYAYGGGLEYAIPTTSFVNVFHSSAVTLKAEYIRYNLGSQALGNGTVRNTGNLVRGGINYKFDFFGAAATPSSLGTERRATLRTLLRNVGATLLGKAQGVGSRFGSRDQPRNRPRFASVSNISSGPSGSRISFSARKASTAERLSST